MSPRAIASAVAAGRILIGAGLISQPERVIVPWIGREGRREGARVLGRALGARDLVLGAGAISCADEQLQPWLIAALAADTADLLATAGAGPSLPFTGRVAVGAMAFGAVLAGVAALAGLNR